ANRFEYVSTIALAVCIHPISKKGDSDGFQHLDPDLQPALCDRRTSDHHLDRPSCPWHGRRFSDCPDRQTLTFCQEEGMNGNGHQQPTSIGATSDTRQNVVCDFSVLLKRLRAGIQRQDIRKHKGWRDRTGRMYYMDFVEWPVVADLLDRLVPEW